MIFAKGSLANPNCFLPCMTLPKALSTNYKFDAVPHQTWSKAPPQTCLFWHTWSYFDLDWIFHNKSHTVQSTVVGGCQSGISSVASGVAQGSVLDLLLFLIYINDLPFNISSQIRLFADYCIIYLELSSATSPQQLQSDLDSLSLWAAKWQMQQVF